ncbi:hypothetical protein BH11BAC1_BH11BAC1_28630 [soil metagenome]
MKLLYTLRTKILVLFLLGALTSNAQLTVDSTFSPTLMVQTLLGGGVTVSNVTYTGDTTHASGFFNEPSSAFGVANGIILTSGSVTNALGPNNQDAAQFDNLLMGDLLLDQYTTGLTQDATILEFDFTSISDSILFNSIMFLVLKNTMNLSDWDSMMYLVSLSVARELSDSRILPWCPEQPRPVPLTISTTDIQILVRLQQDLVQTASIM